MHGFCYSCAFLFKKIIMKKVSLLISLVFLFAISFAQSPNSFKYQTVVRDFSGNIMANHNVSFQFSILQGTASGSSVYTETHLVTTNEFGLVNLNIGAGSTSDDFSTIDWGNGPFFIKVELDENGGTTFSEMGTSQLLSVPYAMYANDVANKDDDDADPNNEFQTILKTGNTVTLSNSGGSFTDEVNDGDISSTNELQIMNFSNDTLYLDNGGQVYLGNYSGLWEQNDTNIYYNNGWVGVGTSTPSGKMVVQGDDGVDPDSALFEVKNKEGQTIFAVYDGGVRIWVDDTGAKANTDKGGFAVGGYRLNKSISSEYLRVTPDSVRVYIREDDGTKSNTDKGGFAVGGYRLNKSSVNQYFNINPNLDADTLNPSEARIYWYPLKEAFMSGRVLVESVDSVGLNSWATGFESKSIGDFSQALGYKARAKGDNSTAIGYSANADSANSYAFGNYALAQDSGSYAIGSRARATGLRSFAIGSLGLDSTGIITSPTTASGDYSYSFGMGSLADTIGAFAIGTSNTASGKYSLAMGVSTKASGDYSTSMGLMTRASGTYSTASGKWTTASGQYAVATGYSSIASGFSSTSMGLSTTASGNYSTAIGYLSESIGSYSTAMGYQTEANAYGSTSMGYKTKANSTYSTALGNTTEANGASSFATGNGTRANGDYSFTTGLFTKANGSNAFAIGSSSKANGFASVAMGRGSYANGYLSFAINETKANSYYEFTLGRYNDTTNIANISTWVDTDALFVVGNGADDANRNNALTVLKNGYVGIGTSAPNSLFHVNSSTTVNPLRIQVNGGTALFVDKNKNVSIGFVNTITGNSVLAIINGAAPTASLTGGILLYSQDVSSSAELRVRDEAGNITTLSPHNFSLTKKSDPMAWSFYSRNENVGEVINVDMLKAMRIIEKLSGEKLVYLQDIKTKELIEQDEEKSLIDIIEEQKQENKKQQKEIEQLKLELKQIKEALEIK